MWPGGWRINTPGAHLILVGLSGSGKSTVGRGVASVLGWPFIDLDEEIVRREGQSIGDLFASHGESHFRELERRETERLRGAPAAVIASGGGWPTIPETVALLRPPAHLAYLRVSPEAALWRLRRTIRSRPLLQQDPAMSLARLLEARRAAYEAADFVIDTEHYTPEEVMAKIVDRICERDLE